MKIKEKNNLKKYHFLLIKTIPVDIAKLYVSLKLENWTNLLETAHRLKGAFAMLKLNNLTRICILLESSILKKNKSAIKSNTDAIHLIIESIKKGDVNNGKI